MFHIMFDTCNWHVTERGGIDESNYKMLNIKECFM